MEIFKNVLTILSLAGIPSVVATIMSAKIIRRMDADKKARDDNMFLLMRMSVIGMELGEATAISCKNHNFNGEITAALEKAQKIKSEYNDFIAKQCVQTIK